MVMLVPISCQHCEFDEAEGGLMDQCLPCRRQQADEDGYLLIDDAWHPVTRDGERVIDICNDISCAGSLYA